MNNRKKNQENKSKKPEVIIDSIKVDFGCQRRRDRDRDRDRDTGINRPTLDLSNLDGDELKERIEYLF